MNLNFKGLGAERKKVAILGGLMLLLGYFFYSNVIAPSDDVPRSTPAAAPAPRQAAPSAVPEATITRRPARGDDRPRRQEFSMSPRDKRPDPTTIDPTLRLDLLAKLQAIGVEGGQRNLFQFGSAPLPKTPEPKIIPARVQAEAAAARAEAAQPAAPPPPPPIPLKFYGYSSRTQHGEKRAFFLDGEEIVVAGEGQLIKNRYKVVRIEINSVVMEDMQLQNQQTLPLEEQAG